MQGNFKSETPNKKLIGDITQLPTADGTLYISGIYDCFDSDCLGLSMDDNMRDELTQNSLKMAAKHQNIKGQLFTQIVEVSTQAMNLKS